MQRSRVDACCESRSVLHGRSTAASDARRLRTKSSTRTRRATRTSTIDISRSTDEHAGERRRCETLSARRKQADSSSNELVTGDRQPRRQRRQRYLEQFSECERRSPQGLLRGLETRGLERPRNDPVRPHRRPAPDPGDGAQVHRGRDHARSPPSGTRSTSSRATRSARRPSSASARSTSPRRAAASASAGSRRR